MRVIFIDGLPGSGKTTLTENLCISLNSKEVNLKSYSELSKTHPIFSLRFQKIDVHSDQYSSLDLSKWRDFVKQAENDTNIHIFDAAPFQNSVRYLLESSSESRIDDYFSQFEEIISPLSPRLIYLRPANAISQSQFCITIKGKEWAKNVPNYLENTKFSNDRNWKGIEGMHNFWDAYATVCDSLVSKTNIPTNIINIVPGEWNRHHKEASTFINKGLP